jgi:hypothetical protein
MDAFDIEAFLSAVARQDTAALTEYFTPDAEILWYNTNELFTVSEYVRANCEYPGSWNGKVEREEKTQDGVAFIAKVWSGENVCRTVSFITLKGSKIKKLKEYWGDVGAPPEWRRNMRIGTPISTELY